MQGTAPCIPFSRYPEGPGLKHYVRRFTFGFRPSLAVRPAHLFRSADLQAVAFRTAPRIALPRQLEVPASKRYLDLLVEGAKAIGLDKEYVRGLEELPRAPVSNGIEKWISRSFAMFFFFWAVRQVRLDSSDVCCIFISNRLQVYPGGTFHSPRIRITLWSVSASRDRP